jgi:uncharacterized protein YeeX (DUF496 family)
MKEILHKNIQFRIRDFLNYSHLDQLNLYNMVRIQLKLKKYQKKLPKKLESETPEEYQNKIQNLINEGDIILSDDQIDDLIEIMKAARDFERKIDQLLIEEPSFEKLRPSIISSLHTNDQYKEILKNVKDDIKAAMSSKTSPKKKALEKSL